MLIGPDDWEEQAQEIKDDPVDAIDGIDVMAKQEEETDAGFPKGH